MNQEKIMNLYNYIMLSFIKRDIKKYFNFLFEKGYCFTQYKKLSMGDWIIKLETKECSIIFFSDRKEFDIGFAPTNTNITNISELRSKMITLGGIIYYVSRGKKILNLDSQLTKINRKERFIKLSNDLYQFYDDIVPIFGKNYQQYLPELFSYGRSYSRLFIDKIFGK
jgi:hypothetical protein